MAKFCSQCGAELLVDAKFCVYCGSAIANPRTEDEKIYTTAVNDEPKAQESGAEAQAGFTPPPVNERPVYHAEPPKVVSPKDAITSMVFGIVSIFMAIFSIYPFAIIAFMPASIIFICLAKVKARRYLREAGREIGFARAGRITSTVAIPLLSFFSIYGLAFTILFIQEII